MMRLQYESEIFNSSAISTLAFGLFWTLHYEFSKFSSSPITISKYAINKKNLWFQNDIIEEVLRMYSIQNRNGYIKFQLEHSDLRKNTPSESDAPPLFDDSYYRKDKAIWFIDSMESFEQLVEDLMDNNVFYNRNGYFCMVYSGIDANPFETLEIMFKLLFDLYVLNINVFLLGKQTEVYTYFPFQPSLCNGYKPKLLVTFGDYDIAEDFKIFPSKLQNLYGCPLLISTWNQNPFVLVDFNKSTGNVKHLYGIEGSIMSLLAERMNFSMRIPNHQPPDRGVVLENGTVTGTIKMVHEGLTNLTVNSWQVDKDRVEYMMPSFSHMSVRVVVAIPKGLKMQSWERITKPFGPRTWITLAASIALAVIFILLVKYWNDTIISWFIFGTDNRKPLTNFLITLYGSVIPNFVPKRNFSRFLLAIWVINAFVLRSAYLSELYFLLKDARARKSLHTLAEIVQKNYTIYAFPVVTSLIKKDYSLGNFRNIDGKHNRTVHFLLTQIQTSVARHVVVALEPTIRYFGLEEINQGREINILSETVITAPLTFYMRKHSYLKHHLNDLIIIISSSGLVHKFEEYYLHRSMLKSRNQSPEPINLVLCQALFKIFIILCICCIFVFLLELMAQRLPRLQKFLDFVNC